MEDTRVAASRQDSDKLSKLTQNMLWLTVGAIKDIGVSTDFIKRAKLHTKSGCFTIPDNDLVKDAISLLGLESAKISRRCWEQIKRDEKNLQELEGQDVHL